MEKPSGNKLETSSLPVVSMVLESSMCITRGEQESKALHGCEPLGYNKDWSGKISKCPLMYSWHDYYGNMFGTFCQLYQPRHMWEGVISIKELSPTNRSSIRAFS